MRTIQPLNGQFHPPKLKLDDSAGEPVVSIVDEPLPDATPQLPPIIERQAPAPVTASIQQAVPSTPISPLVDRAAMPAPPSSRQNLTPALQQVPVAPSTLPPAAAPAPTIPPVTPAPVQAQPVVSTPPSSPQPASQPAPAPTPPRAPLPQPVASVPAQAQPAPVTQPTLPSPSPSPQIESKPVAPDVNHPANISAKPAQPRQTAPAPAQSASKPASAKPANAAPHLESAKPKPAVQSYALDHNDTLMKSSNPFAATLSGIEILIKRNGLVSIGYVSIFVGIYLAIMAGLYSLGRWGGVAMLAQHFTAISLTGLGILLIFIYLHSFVVCVASAAGQSLSLRQVFYLARQKLFKLLILQIITIVGTTIGLLFGIIPGVIILGRWIMAPFMVFESDHPSIMTALKRSNKLTKGRTFEMSGLVLAQIIMLSTGLLGLAAMAAGPAARYQQLRMRLQDSSTITKVHALNYIMSIALCFSFLAGMLTAGRYVYTQNQKVCYSTVVYTSGRPSPSNVCVKRHVCAQDIICKATLKD